MPTEWNEKREVFLINSNGEYKKIGNVQNVSITEIQEAEQYKKANENSKTYDTQGYTATFNYTTKKYKRKRFKKLLMGRGIQRNEAETYSRLFCKTQLELDIFF